jgi:hypothetical protein
VLTAKSRRLAGAIARVAYEHKVSTRKPAHQARQQQPSHVCWRLMPRPVQTIPLRGAVQGHQDGEGPEASGKRQLHEHRHDHPLMAPAIGRIAVRQLHPITMPSLATYLGAKMLGDGIVARQQHRPLRNHMVQQEGDQDTRQGLRRPAALGQHAMIGRDMPRCLRPHGAE